MASYDLKWATNKNVDTTTNFDLLVNFKVALSQEPVNVALVGTPLSFK